jgi:hypothetical protein
MGIAVVGHQLGKSPGRLYGAVRMLVEHFKEVAFTGEEFAKEHGLPGRDYFNFVTYL